MPVSREREPVRPARTDRPAAADPAGAGRAAADAARGRRAARLAGVLVSGNRRQAAACPKARSSRESTAGGSSSPVRLRRLQSRAPAHEPAPPRRNRMNVTTSHVGWRASLRVSEPRLTYPILADFATAVDRSHRRRRKADRRRPHAGRLRRQRDDRLPDGPLPAGATPPAARSSSSGVQKRVETMLTMTGAQNFLEVHADEASALASFGG